MKKITVEEYVKFYKRYIELLLKKEPAIIKQPHTAGFSKTLSSDEENEYNKLNEFLQNYHCEFENWEDFSERSFMEVFDHLEHIRKNEPSNFLKNENEYINGLLNRVSKYNYFGRNNELFSNW